MKPTIVSLFCAALLVSCSNAAAPSEYKVKFETSKGTFVVDVQRDWSPLGADRFYELVKAGFYDEARFFRVVPGFVVQWGINKDPKVSANWREKKISDDPVKETNGTGYTRTTQLFINLADNGRLDARGFSPFGKVVEGMEVVLSLYSGDGQKPEQDLIESQGNAYLQREFPKLDYIKTARVE
jgi:peptidyl-prolyl cis-trans isomerase A (cyclophilin A)